jgi:hypothetical protein
LKCADPARRASIKLTVFLTAVEIGGFAAAARKLGTGDIGDQLTIANLKLQLGMPPSPPREHRPLVASG